MEGYDLVIVSRILCRYRSLRLLESFSNGQSLDNLLLRPNPVPRAIWSL
jgi:hypothetical protein